MRRLGRGAGEDGKPVRDRHQNSERLANLIDDVLQLQKIEAGEMSYDLQVLDIRAVVEDAVISNQGYATAYDVNLVLEPPENAPLLMNGDEKRLIQVMSNMISNAAKFSDEDGTVTVGCRKQNGKIRVFVRDTGCGIPEGAEDKVLAGSAKWIPRTDGSRLAAGWG